MVQGSAVDLFSTIIEPFRIHPWSHVSTQVNVVSAALNAVAVGLLDEHARHCVRQVTEAGDQLSADRMVTEASEAIERLARS